MFHATYQPVIGLEVHCQLQTEAKAFSPEPAAAGAAANTHVSPCSLGHLGTLPVMNGRVLRYALRIGLAARCQIAESVHFARKHYFYPDLPKGYQITQHATPLCYDGYIEILPEERPGGDGRAVPSRRIGIRRTHIEEDAGKSVHERDGAHTLLDFNRCGVPLVEIVSEPVLRSPHEAYRFLKKLRQLVRYLGVCDGNMEEGSLRCDANVSVRPHGHEALGTKTELKNLNSLRHVEQALEFEVARQIHCLERGEDIRPETRRWDEDAGETRRLRAKETAPDYRYLPEPDLPPLVITEAQLDAVRAELPEMPEERRRRFVEDLRLPVYDADVLTEERERADYFEAVLEALFKHTKGGNTPAQAKAVSNVVMTDVLRAVNEQGFDLGHFPIEPKRLAEVVYLRLEDEINSSAAAELFEVMLGERERPKVLARKHNLLQVSDEDALRPFIDEVLDRHEKNVHRYRSGKKSLLKFFMGQVMAHYEGSPDPQLLRRLLKEKLEAKRTG